MIKCLDISPVSSFVLFLALFFTLITLTAGDTTPGDSGAGILTLGGTRANSISLAVPVSISNWALSPAGTGINIHEGETLTVGADGDWQVSVSDSSSTTSGHMTEWDGSSYISSKKLAEPLSVSVEDGAAEGIVDTGNDVSLSTTASILAIGSQTGWPNTAQIPVSFKQPVSWNDKVLAGGHSYKIVVTFTISGYP